MHEVSKPREEEDQSKKSYRAFAPEIEELATSWSQIAVTSNWKDIGFFGGSESKPFRMQNGRVVGLAKPGERKGDGIARAAHEKIAPDLAYLLGLPVPPVILCDTPPSVSRGVRTLQRKFYAHW